MSCICWNMCGLGNHSTFLALCEVFARIPSLLYLSKTRITQKKAKSLKVRLGFTCFSSMDSRGNSGSLCLFWNQPIVVTIRSFSVAHIDSVIFYGVKTWHFMEFYGNPVTTEVSFAGIASLAR